MLREQEKSSMIGTGLRHFVSSLSLSDDMSEVCSAGEFDVVWCKWKKASVVIRSR